MLIVILFIRYLIAVKLKAGEGFDFSREELGVKF
jgi:hypothetical protein